MPMKPDDVTQNVLVTDKPVTQVNGKTKKQAKEEIDFNIAVGILAFSWAVIAFLYWSLREYNI